MDKKLDHYTLDAVSRAIRMRFNHQRDIGSTQAHGVAIAAQGIADSLLDTQEEKIAFLQACGCAFISGYPDRA